FSLLQGQLQADSGQCEIPAAWRIVHMRQEITELERSALDYVLDGDVQLRQLQQQLEAASDGAQLAALHAQLDTIDGYSAETRASKLLSGLGFAVEQMQQQVQQFSGGWRMRLN